MKSVLSLQRILSRLMAVLITSLMLASATSANAASSKIGIIVFDGVLTSDVTAPIEVFGAASKKSWFSDYEVVVISATKNTSVLSLIHI